MLIRYYGGNVSLEYLREVTYTTTNGTTFYHLLEAAKKLGFSGKGIACSLEDLADNFLPIIAHVQIQNLYHFVVVVKNVPSKKKIVILDPSKGIVTYTYQSFKEISSNNYLYLTPNKKLPYYRQKKIISTIIMKVLKENRMSFVYLSFLSVVFITLHLLTAYSFQYILDYSIASNITNNLTNIVLFLLLIIVTKLLSEFIRNHTLNKQQLKIEKVLYNTTYEQIITLPHLYYRNRPTGEILTRIIDLSEVRNFVFNIINFLQQDLLVFTFSIVLIFLIEVRLGILTFSLGLVIFLLNVIFQPKFYLHNSILKEESAKMNSYMLETIKGNETIKGLHLEETFIEQFHERLDNYHQQVLKLTKKLFLERYLRYNFVEISNLLFIAIGAYLVMINDLTIGNLLSFQMLLPYVLTAFQNFSIQCLSYYQSKISLNRIRDVYDVKKEEFHHSHHYKYKNEASIIKINNLSYSYDSINYIFNNFNFEVNKSDKLLICGSSGFGKSTLFKLIFKLIEVPLDTIFIKGIDINRLHLNDLRKMITYISQDEILFTKTLKENIILNRSISDEEFREVCKITLVDEIVKEKNIGYDMVLEENGFNLSGGERQRIIIARALLNNSEIYLFDEAFSQIDKRKERIILNGIFKRYKDYTFLNISHRYSNKDLFTKQIFLDRKGKYHDKKNR